MRDGRHSWKDGFLDFRCANGKRERAEFRLVRFFLWTFSSHRRSSAGNVSLLVRSHVACVLNHRKIIINIAPT